MVRFGGCGQIILLYKSTGGIKTTEILLWSIFWIKWGHAGILNLCEQKFVVIILQYCCPLSWLYYTLNPDIKNKADLLCGYIDLQIKVHIWSVLVDAVK